MNNLHNKEVVNFLHIGKTGGTAILHALTGRLVVTKHHLLKFHHHPTKLKDIPINEKIVFFLRDPVSRFVSGFYSRKRMGKPKFYVPWNKEEEIAFALFQTPNELANAISSTNLPNALSAKKAMNGIYHVKSSFWDWFEHESYFLSRQKDILFIGFQETLEQDFEKLKNILNLPDKVTLPRDNVLAHKLPVHFSTHLDWKATQNIKEWYRKDYKFINMCRDLQLLHAQQK